MKMIFTGLVIGLSGMLAAGDGYDFDDYEKSYGKVQKIRFVQDDAQTYQMSKVYELKHQKAHDLTPYIAGMVNRYDTESKVNRVNDKGGGKQFLTVTTDTRLFPYVDAAIAKLDRPAALTGTGIVYGKYAPKYRHGAVMVDVVQKAGVHSTSLADARLSYEGASNLIYWKDGDNKSNDLYTYLAMLDRPLPQANLVFKVYEVRESMLRDLGIDYLAWKNGPGLNLLSIGFDAFSLDSFETIFNMFTQQGFDVLGNMGGSFGSMFFAPSFDASFIRMLQQDGRAKIAQSANLTVVNRDNGTFQVSFAPQPQNMIKSDRDRSSVVASDNAHVKLTVKNPTVCFDGKPDKRFGLLPYTVEAYRSELGGKINFGYDVEISTVVERNNHGNELVEKKRFESVISAPVRTEKILAVWEQDIDVEQTIGVPFLCELPILKYIFGVTTTSKEKTISFAVVQADFLHPDESMRNLAGRFMSLDQFKPEDAAAEPTAAKETAPEAK